MEKIRILHCLETVGSGGVEQTRLSLSKHLDKKRFEQKIICTQTLGPLRERLEANGMEVIPVGLFKGPFQIGQYRKVLAEVKRFRPHIIHGAVFEGITMAAVSGKIGRVPGIIIEETSDPVGRSWKGHLLMKAFSHVSDRVIAVSPSVGDYVAEMLHIPAPKLQVINNGVEVPVPPSEEEILAVKETLGIQRGELVVGSAGRLLDSHKRFSDLIRAIALLKDRGLRLKLLIAGEGPDLDALTSLSETLGVEDRIVFAGYQGQMTPYYGCMDIFALASGMEAFGLVLAEAMLLRLPVIATSVGGIRDVVSDGVTGILVERFSPPLFARWIEALYNDPARRRQMGEAGYVKAMGEYTASVYAGRIEKLYLDVCREKGIPIMKTGT